MDSKFRAPRMPPDSVTSAPTTVSPVQRSTPVNAKGLGEIFGPGMVGFSSGGLERRSGSTTKQGGLGRSGDHRTVFHSFDNLRKAGWRPAQIAALESEVRASAWTSEVLGMIEASALRSAAFATGGALAWRMGLEALDGDQEAAELLVGVGIKIFLGPQDGPGYLGASLRDPHKLLRIEILRLSEMRAPPGPGLRFYVLPVTGEVVVVRPVPDATATQGPVFKQALAIAVGHRSATLVRPLPAAKKVVPQPALRSTARSKKPKPAEPSPEPSSRSVKTQTPPWNLAAAPDVRPLLGSIRLRRAEEREPNLRQTYPKLKAYAQALLDQGWPEEQVTPFLQFLARLKLPSRPMDPSIAKLAPAAPNELEANVRPLAPELGVLVGSDTERSILLVGGGEVAMLRAPIGAGTTATVYMARYPGDTPGVVRVYSCDSNIVDRSFLRILPPNSKIVALPNTNQFAVLTPELYGRDLATLGALQRLGLGDSEAKKEWMDAAVVMACWVALEIVNRVDAFGAVVDGDTKPSNFVVGFGGRPHAIDDGLHVFRDELSSALGVAMYRGPFASVQTPGFRAPEGHGGLLLPRRLAPLAWAMTAYQILFGASLMQMNGQTTGSESGAKLALVELCDAGRKTECQEVFSRLQQAHTQMLVDAGHAEFAGLLRRAGAWSPFVRCEMSVVASGAYSVLEHFEPARFTAASRRWARVGDRERRRREHAMDSVSAASLQRRLLAQDPDDDRKSLPT